MSCPAEDGRYVPGALRVRHSTATMVVMVMVPSHVVTRRILGAGGYCLTAAGYVVIVVVVDAVVVVAAAATAAADVGAAAAVVVGRIHCRLAGVI